MEAFLESKELGQFRLNRPLSIGRSSTNDIPVNGTEVSRRHTLINVQEGGQVWVVDLGSTNGTYLNDRRVIRPTALNNGDRITLGGKTFVFRSTATKKPVRAAGETQLLTQPAFRIEKAWLLLADIIGFTRFAQQHPPEKVSSAVGSWMLACSTIFQNHGADIQIYTGDGYLAYVTDRGADPKRFFAIFAELRAYQAKEKELPFRLLTHYDDITLGATSPSGAESILGPGVILLFRMEKIAAKHKANCTFTTAAVQHWPEKIAPVSLGKHELNGFTDTHELFSL
ncbi:MAG TPA: FHA domain-containing protein [Lacunisphaera sp.]|nr:FHA domain-containing protein [Lacunisphaera sp.]